MKTIGFDAPYFTKEDEARTYLENLRWPNGPVCPHCGAVAGHYEIVPKATSKSPARKGLWKCSKCRKQFSVTVGTVFESSHIPLNKWLLATFLLCSSKKGMSAHQLHRMLKITYKSAWFMAHRIRYAMEQKLDSLLSGVVEADETYVGGKEHGKAGRPGKDSIKVPVFSLVERHGRVVSQPVERVTWTNLRRAVVKNVAKSARMITDDFPGYRSMMKDYASHDIIRHNEKQYVNGDVHTNTVEGYFSLLKRGIIGVYHHVGSNHLHRYLSEFDMRYNKRKVSDTERTIAALVGIGGKRLTYRD